MTMLPSKLLLLHRCYPVWRHITTDRTWTKEEDEDEEDDNDGVARKSIKPPVEMEGINS